MDGQPFLITERLLILPLAVADVDFIFELLNTEGWIRFIGDRNIASQSDAIAYIQKIGANTNINYWVVKHKSNEESMGIVTYIKRDYLEHHDIGFAFLPKFFKNGYAYEATTAVLNKLIKERNLAYILATTVPENVNSIKLLKKIGLSFEKEIAIESRKLQVYGASADTVKASMSC